MNAARQTAREGNGPIAPSAPNITAAQFQGLVNHAQRLQDETSEMVRRLLAIQVEIEGLLDKLKGAKP